MAKNYFKALPIGGRLNRIALKIEPEERVKKVRSRDRRPNLSRPISDDVVRAIRSDYENPSTTLQMIAEKYGVSVHAVRRIVDGETYQDVK